MRSQSVVVIALGTSQTLAWASSYYLPAILANDIAFGTGVSRAWVFGTFSVSLLLAAFAGPAVGRQIDRGGGKAVLVASNVAFAIGLVALAASSGPVMLAIAWAVLGMGMALGLYDSAFATLTGLYGRDARRAITGITLIAGFASTIGWPLSAFMDSHIGWRGACLVWAALHVVVGLPLNLFLVPTPAHLVVLQRHERGSWEPRKEMFLLAYVFAAA
jgi:MFS family permease